MARWVCDIYITVWVRVVYSLIIPHCAIPGGMAYKAMKWLWNALRFDDSLSSSWHLYYLLSSWVFVIYSFVKLHSAITGGMAYEAMNCAGYLKQRMIVILNDNGQVSFSLLYIYTHINTYTYMYIGCMYIYLYIHIHILMNIHMYIYNIYIYIYDMYLHVLKCIYVHILTHSTPSRRILHQNLFSSNKTTRKWRSFPEL